MPHYGHFSLAKIWRGSVMKPPVYAVVVKRSLHAAALWYVEILASEIEWLFTCKVGSFAPGLKKFHYARLAVLRLEVLQSVIFWQNNELFVSHFNLSVTPYIKLHLYYLYISHGVHFPLITEKICSRMWMISPEIQSYCNICIFCKVHAVYFTW